MRLKNPRRVTYSLAAALAAAGLWLAGTSPAKGEAQTSRHELASGEAASSRYRVEAGQAVGVLVSVPEPRLLTGGGRIEVAWEQGGADSGSKALHQGDPDLYVIWEGTPGTASVSLKAAGLPAGGKVPVNVTATPLGKTASAGARIATALHGAWQRAEPIELGRPVYASGDDRPYIPAGRDPEAVFQQMLEGVHWYTFEHRGPGDLLVHFNVEILDRDVPVDVAVFTIENGKPVPYTRGRERFEPEHSTILHGLYKFAPRVIAPGRYYVRVMGNHPFYKLETTTYPVPPYEDARQAVRVAMDYIVRKGDSWHANIPRKGYVALRTTNQLQETRLCIACHPTHFSTRAELTAVENGYRVQARQSLQFLVERLYNNPRPIYGKPDASWARMIHAPGNVLSRLAYIANKFETNLSRDRREELYRGIAGYLEMYWPGVGEPQQESNGNLPRISGFEIAQHSGLLFEDLHRRTGEARYQRLREQIEQVALGGEPNDMLDLCWKLVALASLGGDRHQAEIARLAEEIFRHQKSDGSWAMPFGNEIVEYDWRNHKMTRKPAPPVPGHEGPLRSDFQTYHAIYALAVAGVTMDDPRLAKAVAFCLRRQTESGAWQGTPEYKNFDTPFRDTQYAIMALSSLFPGPVGRGGVKGWNSGHPAPPESFDEADAAATVHALDQHWDRPPDATVERIRGLLGSPHVLVRFQAAVTLGRFADEGSVEALAKRLGDPSKLVQRGAAWALRQIASRRAASNPSIVPALASALRSPSERVRWGATRIFNQHFKYLAEDWRLGGELLRLAREEPVPAVRMAAIQSLYQWWFWDRDLGHKEAIERTLLAGLGEEADPWVRRNFIEAYYNVLDDNLRYLYGSWMVRVKQDQDREAIRQGHREHVRAQAARFRDAMREGGPLTRDGLLRALSSHVLRQGLSVSVAPLDGVKVPETLAGPWINGYKWFALFDPLEQTSGERASIGNDSDPPLFYEDSAPLMNEAFVTALADGEGPSTANVVHAMLFLKPFQPDARVAERLLALAADAPAEMARTAAAKGAQSLLPGAEIASPEVIAQLARMLEGEDRSVAVAAAVLEGDSTGGLTGDPGLAAAVRARLNRAEPAGPAFASLVRAMIAMPGLRSDPALIARALAGLNTGSSGSRRAAFQLVLAGPGILASAGLRSTYEQALASASEDLLLDGLAVAATFGSWKEASREAVAEAARLLLAGMRHPSTKVRTEALSAFRVIEPLRQDEKLLAEIDRLAAGRDSAVRNSARTLKASLDAQTGVRGFSAGQILDYEFFRVRVEPLLVSKGRDGLACANCHANHNIFKLIPPDQYGNLTLEQSRRNYQSALGVVNVADPESSLILNKPISDLDDQGIGNSREFSHGGGLRWVERKNSSEYRTVLRWLQGERLDAEVAEAAPVPGPRASARPASR